MSDYVLDEVTDAEIDRQAAIYGPLAQSVRELIDAALRTEMDGDVVTRATEEIRGLTATLQEKQMPGSFGVRWSASGTKRDWGNAVLGLRNAVAPPVVLNVEPDGRVVADFSLGAAYEGPAGLTHGGVTALILDNVLGAAAEAGGSPGMTGTLTIRYRRPTPLGEMLHAEAKTDRVEGVKTFVRGTISDAGGVCVEAEGVFILPRWARAALAAATPGGIS